MLQGQVGADEGIDSHVVLGTESQLSGERRRTWLCSDPTRNTYQPPPSDLGLPRVLPPLSVCVFCSHFALWEPPSPPLPVPATPQLFPATAFWAWCDLLPESSENSYCGFPRVALGTHPGHAPEEPGTEPGFKASIGDCHESHNPPTIDPHCHSWCHHDPACWGN